MDLEKFSTTEITVSPALVGLLLAMSVQFAGAIWWASGQTEKSDHMSRSVTSTQDQVGNVSVKLDNLMTNTTGTLTRMETMVQVVNDHEARIRSLERNESRVEMRLDQARQNSSTTTVLVPQAVAPVPAPLNLHPQSTLDRPSTDRQLLRGLK